MPRMCKPSAVFLASIGILAAVWLSFFLPTKFQSASAQGSTPQTPPVLIVASGGYGYAVNGGRGEIPIFQGNYVADYDSPSFHFNEPQLSLSVSIGVASASIKSHGIIEFNDVAVDSAVFGGAYNRVGSSGGFNIYILGGPGTRFHVEYSSSGSVEAKLINDEPRDAGYGRFSAALSPGSNGGRNLSVFTQTIGDSFQDSDSHSTFVEGTTTNQTINYRGAIYSFATSGGSNTGTASSEWFRQHNHFTGTASFDSSFDVSAHRVRNGQQPPVAILSGPSNVDVGQNAEFNGIESYDPDGAIIEYKWVVLNSSGATVSLGPIVDHVWNTPGTYRVSLTVTDNDGQTGTANTTIVVALCRAPTITAQPNGQTILGGQNATLSVLADGTSPLTYQWYEGDSGDITKPVGINSPTFTTPSLSTSTKYWVLVSNSCGTVNSTVITITVENRCKVSDISPITDQDALKFENAAPDPPNDSLFPPYVESTLSTAITNLQGSINATLGFLPPRTSGYRPLAYQAHLYELYTKLKAIQEAVNTDPLQADACAQLKGRIDDEIDHKHEIARSGMTNLPLVNPPAVSAHTTNPANAVDLGSIRDLPPAQQNIIDQLARQNGVTRPCSNDDKPHFTLKGTPCHLTLSITVQSPINILVTDPLGRRIGFDPVMSSVVNEIGSSAYYSGPSTEPQLLNIGAMFAGPYMISAIGTATGSYTITIQTLDEDAGLNSSQVISGNITLGQTISLTTAATYTISGRAIDAGGAGIGGVTISLSGSQTASRMTDNDGNYSFGNLPTGSYTITPAKSRYTFSPENEIISNLSSSETANFTGTVEPFSIAGRVTINDEGLSGVTITLGGSVSQVTDTDQSGNYQFTNLQAGGNYTITPTKTNYTFTPQNPTFSNLNGNQVAIFSASINPGVPILVSEKNSTRAIALGSPAWLRDPFPLTSPVPWELDRRTRVMLFAMNFGLLSGENSSIITADAEDVSHNIYQLTVEYVGKVPGYDWLNCVIVRLNDNMSDVGDVLVRLTVRGVPSNRVRLGVGHIGGGPPDDEGAVPTPGRQPN
jgi:PKD domain/Carboxypeptidase regulatory-like domain/Ig-like domain CHU_C associated